MSPPRRLGWQNPVKLVSSRGTTGDTGRLAPLGVPQEKMDMAKATLLEPQRLSVMLAVVSPANGTMGPNAVELSGANGGRPAQERGAVQYPQIPVPTGLHCRSKRERGAYVHRTNAQTATGEVEGDGQPGSCGNVPSTAEFP